MRGRVTVVWLLLLAGQVAAEPPSPVDVPTLDVEANVRRMLEESRTRAAGLPEGGPAPVDVEANVQRTLTDGAAPAAETAPLPAPTQRPAAAPAPAVKPVVKPAAPRPTATPAPHMEYVPMPDKEITIRSVGDVGAVAQELENARGRGGEQK